MYVCVCVQVCVCVFVCVCVGVCVFLDVFRNMAGLVPERACLGYGHSLRRWNLARMIGNDSNAVQCWG